MNPSPGLSESGALTSESDVGNAHGVGNETHGRGDTGVPTGRQERIEGELP